MKVGVPAPGGVQGHHFDHLRQVVPAYVTGQEHGSERGQPLVGPAWWLGLGAQSEELEVALHQASDVLLGQGGQGGLDRCCNPLLCDTVLGSMLGTVSEWTVEYDESPSLLNCRARLLLQ